MAFPWKLTSHSFSSQHSGHEFGPIREGINSEEENIVTYWPMRLLNENLTLSNLTQPNDDWKDPIKVVNGMSKEVMLLRSIFIGCSCHTHTNL